MGKEIALYEISWKTQLDYTAQSLDSKKVSTKAWRSSRLLVDVTSLDSLQIRSRSNLVQIPPKASAWVPRSPLQ